MSGFPGSQAAINAAIAAEQARANAAYAALLAPSGDTTGVTDTAAINAITQAGKWCILRAGGHYYLSSSIYLASHAVLWAYGAIVDLPASILTNMIRTTAVDAAVTATDGVTVATSATLTSATIAAAATVGQTVGVVGAGAAGSTWYGTISSINTGAGTLVLSNAADVSIASGATVYLYTTRNIDITVAGGTWNVLGSLAGGHVAGSTAFNSFASCFRRVDGLTIRDMTWTTVGTGHQGGKFTISLADVTSYLVENIVFNGTAGDGVHVTGPATDGIVRNIQGTTGDDMVVANDQDSNTPLITDTQGALANLQIKGINGNNTWRTAKLYTLGTSKKFQMSQISIDEVKGSSQNEGVHIIGNIYVTDELSIRNITVATGGGASAVYCQNCQSANSVVIDNVAWPSTTAASNGIVHLDTMRGPARVRNVSLTSAPAGTNYGVQISGSSLGNGSSFGSSFDIDGVFCVRGTATVPATFHPVWLNGTGGTLQAMTIRNIHALPSSAGTVLLVSAGTVLQGVNISDVVFSGTSLVSLPSSTSAATIRVSNASVTGTNLVTTGSPLTLELVNVDVNTSGAVVAVAGANATPVRVMAKNVSQAGAGAGVSRDSTQSISVDGHHFSVDLALLTPQDGDMAYDGSSRTAATGAAVFHTGGTGNGWKNIYTGATY